MVVGFVICMMVELDAPAGQACHESSIGVTAILARTLASHACGSTLLGMAVLDEHVQWRLQYPSRVSRFRVGAWSIESGAGLKRVHASASKLVSATFAVAQRAPWHRSLLPRILLREIDSA
jgi:hypothetical protein